MKSEYTVLPAFYDILNSDVDYEKYADFLCSFFDVGNSSVLDLGCGTGDLSLILATRGAKVLGLDASFEMLTLAEHKANEKGIDVFYTCQDMTSFITPRQYDAVISTFDSLNYLKTKTALDRTFQSVFRELKEGGVFLFDMNSEYKFRHVYGDNSYVIENDGVFCAWENYFDEKSKKCHFYINIFAEKSGKYTRYYEEQTERMFTLKEIKSSLEKSGFTLEKVYSDYDKNEITKTTERYYFVARK